jgi:UDPglucose--hexose-1-phosphate uridylyltransferase
LPELRKDPITGRWVIFSSERSARPQGAGEGRGPEPGGGGECPFCEGHEKSTPPEIYAVREFGTGANTPGWRVRVVPNKFPALRIEGDLEKHGEGIYDRMNGVGAHEVFVEGPRHLTTPGELSPSLQLDAGAAHRERMRDLRKDRRFAYGLLFKNVGRTAGASLLHNHSQLIATPVVPVLVQHEMDGAKRFFDYRGRCLFCDMVEQEISDKARLVEASERFVAFVPYAARFPYEMWILPRGHQSHFEAIDDEDLAAYATILASCLRRLEKTLDRPPYNTMLHTGPWIDGALDHYHWHLEVIPRVTTAAGFEWGSGFYINPVLPEFAAVELAKAAT